MIDFTPWNTLLHRYVDDQGRVNYQTWQREALTDLNQWLDQVAAIAPTLTLAPALTIDRNQQLALWLNLYNALTIRQVLDRYPITSIQPRVLGVPNWPAFLAFFSRPVFSLAGQTYSLNAIEHGILRPTFQEPRIHFALVCASIGCPLLRQEAYWPDRVGSQLEDDAQRFMANPDKVQYNAEEQTLYCSKIFKWYRADFLQVASSIPTYIQPYLANGGPLTETTPIRYLNYDWNLNQQSRSP